MNWLAGTGAVFERAGLSDSGRRLLAVVVLGLFAAYSGTYLWITAARFAADPIGDFFGLWSCGRFVAVHPAVQVYDPAVLHAAQVAMGMPSPAEYPFPYPPSFLLALAPLGLLPYWPAFALGIGGSLLLFLWATLGRRWTLPFLATVLLAPTTTLGIVAGQGGFLSAALLAGGFRLMGRRPLFAGVLLGLLTYKPQLGLLVPIALIAARQWRTIAAAAATFTLLVLISAVVFEPGIWLAWVDNVAGYSRQFAAENGEIAHLMPTIFEVLAAFGASSTQAWIGQGIVAGLAAAMVWYCFRTGPRPAAAAVLFGATFLATPHAFVYDMPIVATAVVWIVLDEQRRGPSLTPGEILILFLTLAAPITMPAGTSPVPIVQLALMLFVGMAARRCRHSPEGSPAADLSGHATEFP